MPVNLRHNVTCLFTISQPIYLGEETREPCGSSHGNGDKSSLKPMVGVKSGILELGGDAVALVLSVTFIILIFVGGAKYCRSSETILGVSRRVVSLVSLKTECVWGHEEATPGLASRAVSCSSQCVGCNGCVSHLFPSYGEHKVELTPQKDDRESTTFNTERFCKQNHKYIESKHTELIYRRSPSVCLRVFLYA